MNDKITIRRATPRDTVNIALLLREAGVDPAGLEEWVDSFILAETPAESESELEIIATAGLEKYGSKGLLRSLVLRKKACTAEDGFHLLQLILAHTGQIGLSELYLLTESPTLFIHMEFTPVTTLEIPMEILLSQHFRQNSAKAVPMRKILK
ncbi:GNAT family N-acetyltransferase [Effusibacillus consociatus]|uniref:GNAT family N-acetyltransferase n=1 Tax=Effusibacillus consociatus TaxID=1117041 RepID=A0ABV9Q0G1_9BACL